MSGRTEKWFMKQDDKIIGRCYFLSSKLVFGHDLDTKKNLFIFYVQSLLDIHELQQGKGGEGNDAFLRIKKPQMVLTSNGQASQ